jgi:hypothetical protein
MSGATGPSALAPFADDWVGGDIHGLSAFAGTMYRYVPGVNDVTTALDKQVMGIVGAAGWTGSAASAFESAWERDALSAQALGVAIEEAGEIVDNLAVELSKIENALEQAAYTAEKHGVQVGADGRVSQAPMIGPTGGTAAAQVAQWTQGYQDFWRDCMQTAQQARQQAAGALMKLYAQIAPPGPSQPGINVADGNTLADYLGDLWAIPTANRAYIEGTIIPRLKSQASKVVAEIKEVKVTGDPVPEDLWDQSHFVQTELRSARTDLAAAEGSENALTKLLGTTPKDIPAVSRLTDGIGDGTLGKLVDFGEDVPVLDILAAAVGTGVSTYSDVRDGQPWYEGLPEEALANVSGIAAGTVVAGAVTSGIVGSTAIGGGLAALSITGAAATGVAVGAGIIVGGVVAVGVGTFVDNLAHEDWSADIHKDGVVGGVADGIGDSAVKTGKDIAGMASDVGHTAAHLWDSVF